MIPQPDVASSRLEFFDPAQFAADAFESLEGMLVRVEEPESERGTDPISDRADISLPHGFLAAAPPLCRRPGRSAKETARHGSPPARPYLDKWAFSRRQSRPARF